MATTSSIAVLVRMASHSYFKLYACGLQNLSVIRKRLQPFSYSCVGIFYKQTHLELLYLNSVSCSEFNIVYGQLISNGQISIRIFTSLGVHSKHSSSNKCSRYWYASLSFVKDTFSIQQHREQRQQGVGEHHVQLDHSQAHQVSPWLILSSM